MSARFWEQSEHPQSKWMLCWNIAGFDFRNVDIPGDIRATFALRHRSFTSGIQNWDNPSDADKSRMGANNVAALFSAMLISKDAGLSGIWGRITNLEQLPTDSTLVARHIARAFISARAAYIHIKEDCPTEAARTVDEWCEFLDSRFQDQRQPISWEECRHRWTNLVNSGGLLDFGERPLPQQGFDERTQVKQEFGELFQAQQASRPANRTAESSQEDASRTVLDSKGKRRQSRPPTASPSSAAKRQRNSSSQMRLSNQEQAAGHNEQDGDPAGPSSAASHVSHAVQNGPIDSNDRVMTEASPSTLRETICASRKAVAELAGQLDRLDEGLTPDERGVIRGDSRTTQAKLVAVEASLKELTHSVEKFMGQNKNQFAEIEANQKITNRRLDALELNHRALEIEMERMRLTMARNGLQTVAAEELCGLLVLRRTGSIAAHR
ncbi:hypothetical protein VTJ49DRAFT_1544 [Mycothermus thermophilus]|uniref:Uncharacterized protein n=1 Tax=Humicola insolens TaxID=85995 RepID=A0ABR3VND6_HUMIN